MCIFVGSKLVSHHVMKCMVLRLEVWRHERENNYKITTINALGSLNTIIFTAQDVIAKEVNQKPSLTSMISLSTFYNFSVKDQGHFYAHKALIEDEQILKDLKL